MFLELVLLSTLTVTSYQPVSSQTDSSPFHTSTGELVTRGGVAVSRDLLHDTRPNLRPHCTCGKLHYGDHLYISGHGIRYVNDVMGDSQCVRWANKQCVQRQLIRNWVDLFVWTYQEEKAVGVQRRQVYRIKEYAQQ
jgi:hypothetical protein